MQEQSPLTRPELRQQIGAGWLGVVHAAGTGPDGTPLAVRLLSVDRLADVGRLAQRLSFAAHSEHQHILPTTLPASQDGEVFYLMPHALGGSLRGVFERYRAAGAKVDAETMLDVARQVAEGLDYAHSRGVLHGNLKPENVLLQPLPAPHEDEFRLLLTDFGLNNLRTPDPHSPYLPAPQRAGAPTTLETDLYGLGALMFEGVTGRPLPPQPLFADLTDVPEPVAKVVARCLGLNAPFTDVSAFLGYLRALHLAGQTGAAQGSVHLSANHSYLEIIPGETQEVLLKVAASSAARLHLLVEGLPSGWTPSLPPLNLQAGQEAVVTVPFQLPRRASVQARGYEASIVALSELPTTAPGTLAERVELARLPLPIRVQPFDSSQLRLGALQTSVVSSANITATLRNDGNQTQRYNLELNLPPGSRVRKGSARRQLELAPGAEFSEMLEVRLPAAGLSSRVLDFTAQANSVPRPTPAETGDDVRPSEAWPPVFNTVQDHLRLQQRPLVPWWVLALGVTGLLGAGAWAARPPQIEAFGLAGDTPMQGEPFTLTWKTSGAKQVRIAELPGQPLDTAGQLRVPASDSPQTYTLVASGLLTQKRQQVTVTPTRPAPHVEVFKVTPARARLGETVRVDWKVSHAQQVTVQPFGAVPPSGSREFVMKQDTRVELSGRRGTRPSDQDVRSVQTVTLAAPDISVFTISPANVLRGQNVTVRWNTSGARRVRLSPLGDLPASGTRTFPATQTSNYTLKASNGVQETTASASLTVRIPQARIEALTVTPTTPQAGQPVKVQWRTQDASQAELRWGNQRQTVAPSGVFTFSAAPGTGSVTLVAENANGVPAMETRRLQVRVPAPAPAPAVTPGVTVTPAPNATTPTPTTATPAPASTASSPKTTAPRTSASRATAPRATAPGTAARAGRGTVQPPPRASSPTATRPAAPRPTAPSTPPAPTPELQTFTFRPAARAGAHPTLAWKVSGVTKVRISGLTGPNADGTFPAIGTLQLPSRARPGTYVLSAGNGAVRATVQVPASTTRAPASPGGSASTSGTAAPTTRPAPRPSTTSPGDPRIDGNWNHSFGQMSLVVSGNRVTGSVLSSRADLPSGTLRGLLSGEKDTPTLNAFVTEEGVRVALIIRFDLNAHTFDGLYSSRTTRVPWCGWKNPGTNPCP